MFVTILTTIIFILGLTYWYIKIKHQMWQSLGVQVPPYLPIVGHFMDTTLKPLRWEYIDKIYKEYKDLPYWGMYDLLSPSLHIRDKDIIKDVLVKEADHFIDRRDFPHNPKGNSDILFIEMLLHQKGNKWRNLRALLSPTFTSGKIKAMFPSICEKTDELSYFIDNELLKNPVIEIRNLIGDYTLSVIANCAFGLQTQIGEKETDFMKYSSQMNSFDLNFALRYFTLSILPSRLTQLFNIQMGDPVVTDYFSRLVQQTIQMRNENNVHRGDFLDLLEECLQKSTESSNSTYKMTMRSVVSQCMLFIVAGHDTTANAISHTLFVIAQNPEIQEKLRNHLKQFIEENDALTYQNVMEADYLDACISESLRMYGSIQFIDRKCVSEYKVPKTGLVIPKGCLVNIPVWSIHKDEAYWEDPYTFNPDRFLSENKGNITPFSYLPFGGGPRNCIGMRFALLEMKTAIAKILLKYRLTLPAGHEKLIFNQDMFQIKATENGIRINFEKIL